MLNEEEDSQITFCKAVRTNAIQLQYNCNTRIFFLCCSCIALVRTPAIQRCNTSFLQLAENLQATCSSCKKLVLHCACVDCCNTTKFLCYCSCTVVVLHLCGPLNVQISCKSSFICLLRGSLKTSPGICFSDTVCSATKHHLRPSVADAVPFRVVRHGQYIEDLPRTDWPDPAQAGELAVR